MDTEFRLTGKLVLAMLVGFFLVILIANIFLINFAVKSFPGEKEEKSYLQGLNYNQRLAARTEQALLDWTTTIDEASLVDDHAAFEIVIKDANALPIPNLDVVGILSRPANDDHDHSFTFKGVGNGTYIGTAPASAGLWELEGTAIDNRGNSFVFTSRLVLQ